MNITKEKLDMLLEAMVGKEFVDAWWYSPNKAFDDQKPAEVDLQIVADYLMWHAFAAGG